MIDLSLMKGIHVDPGAAPSAPRAASRGASFNRETQLHGLASTGGVGLQHGHRRPHAGRRARLAHGQACAGARQSAVGRTRAGGRQVVTRASDENAGPVLGRARRRRQFRCGDIPGVPPASVGPHGHRRPDRLSRSTRPGTCCATSATSPPRCPTSLPSLAALTACAGRVGAEARRHRALPLRSAGRRREGGAADQGVRQAGHGCDRADALPPDEHHAGRGLSARRAQLLEVELPRRR